MTEQDVPVAWDVAKQAMADGTHMSMTLNGTPGRGITLDVLGDVCRSWDGLLKAVGKEVSVSEPMEWRVVSLAVIEDTIRIGVMGQVRRKRKRGTK